MKTLPSKEEFEAYVAVQKSGVTNMFMVTTICELSGLNRETVLNIMEQYHKLNELYPEVTA